MKHEEQATIDIMRQFNQQQKQALYWLSSGRCEMCGIQLPNGWHADHVHPYAHGGHTDVINGQALCPTCNLKKGTKLMTGKWPEKIELRIWQEEFVARYRALSKSDFLLVATPGAGKTIAALRIAHELMNSGTVEQIVIVCPTDQLRTQWLLEAPTVNINLDRKTIGHTGAIMQTSDYVGLVVTYPEVMHNEERLRLFTSRRKTLVIFDEIHHCGDAETLAWGDAIKKAFQPARARLLLSGTPFRSDNHPIPFVTYEHDPKDLKWQRSKPDFTYGYGDALRDGKVVRHIIFSGWDGEFAWSDSFYGEERKASFQDLLNKQDANRRLKIALDPDEPLMRKMLVAANQRLEELRRVGHTNAGGLVVAESQESAETIAAILHQEVGEKPVLALSKMGDAASEEIKKFRTGNQKWIVAVRMVSEGVDIKRLRVGVYANNVKTNTFFRQVIGRVIRWDNDKRWNDLYDQTAYFYIPEDPILLRLAKTIKDELDHYIEERDEADKKQADVDAGTPQPFQMAMDGGYDTLYADGDEKHHHADGQTFDKNELTAAEKAFRGIPGFEQNQPAHLANALRVLGIAGGQTQTTDSSSDEPAPTPIFVQKANLQKMIRRKTGDLVFRCREKGISLPGNNPYQVINNAWGRARKYSSESTNDELQEKLDWLERLITRVKRGDTTVISELRS